MLTKRQWIGVAILVAMIGATKVVITIQNNRHSVPNFPIQEVTDSISVIRLHPFDPNTADSMALIEIGLQPWQVRNMLKYRAKGGRYHDVEDFQTLYGLTDSAYLRLKPYICIDSSEWVARRDSLQRARQMRDSVWRTKDSLRYDSLMLARHGHIKRDTMIELNTTDTSDLQYIRGIGAYVAMQIVRYREQLGGYYCIEQVREIPHVEMVIWDSIIPSLMVDTTYIQRITVNHCSVRQLARHPYLRYEQAQAIYTYRREHFKIRSIQELYTIRELQAEDIARIAPYISFEE